MRPGFSLVEMLIALAIMAILTTFSLPLLQHFIARHEARLQQTKLLADIATLREAANLQGTALPLSLDPSIHWRGFPNTHTVPYFSAQGLVNNDNGTFWYCRKGSTYSTWVLTLSRTGEVHVSPAMMPC